MTPQELLNAILMASVFVLVFSGWSICVLLWTIQYAKHRKWLQKRIGVVDEQTHRSDKLQLWREEFQVRRASSARNRRETLGERLERLRVDAGWKAPALVVLAFVLLMALLATAAPVLLGYRFWLGLALGLIILALFWVLTTQRIAQRLVRFERQIVEALGIAARALRAGHPLVGAFQSVAGEIPEPVGAIFGEICQEQALGLDLQDSIRRVADATRNTDLKLLATAVNIQLRTGGNMAELMETLAAVMRSRMRLNRRVRVLTASSRMSKYVLLTVPVVLFVILNIGSPEYVSVFYTTWLGRYMLIGTGISVLLGAWIMNRLCVLRY
jgi:tight adherence protein B